MKEINIIQEKGAIHIKGTLGFDTVEYALEKTKVLITYDDTLTLNLEGVMNCDSASLAFVAAVLREAKKKRTKLLFKKVPSQMLDLSRVSGLDGLITLTEA